MQHKLSAGKLALSDILCFTSDCCLQIYGEKQPLNDPEFAKLHEMNEMVKDACHQVENDPIMDLYPTLFKLRKFLFRKTDRLLEKIDDELKTLVLPKISEAKVYTQFIVYGEVTTDALIFTFIIFIIYFFLYQFSQKL